MDYNARYYSTRLGRFVSPDTVVPDEENPQHWNRYSYVYNNPLKFVDSTGHCGGPVGASDGSVGNEEFVEQVCNGGGGSSSDVTGESSGSSGQVSTGSQGSGRGGSGSQAPIDSGSGEVDDLVRQAQNAQRQAENLHQQHNLGDKTVAVSGNDQQTLSGWNHKNPNFTQVDVDDVFARGAELDHQFPSRGGLDQDVSGQWSASHAEKQMSILEPNQPMGIAGRNMCTNCQRYFQKVAIDTGRIQVVADRQVTRIFFPDGRTTLRFPD